MRYIQSHGVVSVMLALFIALSLFLVSAAPTSAATTGPATHYLGTNGVYQFNTPEVASGWRVTVQRQLFDGASVRRFNATTTYYGPRSAGTSNATIFMPSCANTGTGTWLILYNRYPPSGGVIYDSAQFNNGIVNSGAC